MLLFLIVNFQILQLSAQKCDSAYLKINKAYVLSYFEDAGDIATAPLRWDKKQWVGFAGFTGVTLLTYAFDESISEFTQRNRTDTKDKLTKYVFDPLGTYYLVGIVGGMYVYGLVAQDQHTETAALLTGKAVVLTGAYTFLFKNIFQRKRPYESEPPDPNYWGGPFDGFNHNSFPSGHTSVVFAAATVLSGYYKEKTWVGITAFSMAGLVAISRNYDDKHWASDIVAGAALGYAVGKLVCNKQRNKRLQITPYGSLYGQGVSLRYSL